MRNTYRRATHTKQQKLISSHQRPWI